MTTWVNGEIVDDTAPVVRADDHGLVVGDGVFETIKVIDGRPFAITRHLARLQRSAAGLGLADDLDVDAIRAGVDAVLARTTQPRARLRITVTGGPGPYGSDRGETGPTILIATAGMHHWPETADVCIVPWTRNERSAVAGLKTTSYAENVVALAFAHQRDAAEAIFPNSRDELCEGTGSNIFVAIDGRLITPPLSSGCLAGVTRELLLEWVDDVEERDLPIEALARVDEAFLASSTRDVQAIRAVDGVMLPTAPGPLTKAAAEIFAARSATEWDP